MCAQFAAYTLGMHLKVYTTVVPLVLAASSDLVLSKFHPHHSSAGRSAETLGPAVQEDYGEDYGGLVFLRRVKSKSFLRSKFEQSV